METDAELIGRTMKGMVEYVWQTAGQDRALRAIEDANKDSNGIGIRWVWLDASTADAYRPRISIEKRKGTKLCRSVSFKDKNKEGRRS